MLMDITWKLKAFECPSVIAFENLSRIVSLCGFQKNWSFSVFVTMSIHSWLLFTLIACWLAMSEEMFLKSINLLFLNQIPWIPFSQDKSSIKSQGVWIQRTYLSQESCVGMLSKILSLGNLCSHAWFSQYLEPIFIFWTSILNGRARLLFQGDIILCGLYQCLHAILSSPSSPSSFIIKIYSLTIWCTNPVKIRVSDFANWTIRFWTPDMSGHSTGFQ
jgi:hypothetical protein